MRFFKSAVIIMFFSLIFVFNCLVVADQYGDEYIENNYEDEENYYDDYPPVDMNCWPDYQYLLEVEVGEGVINRQYFGNRKIRLETLRGEEKYFVIYRFTEDEVVEISFLKDEEKKGYIVTSVSYEEFFEMNDMFESLFYKTLPGEELAMPGYEKLGEQVFLNRNVEVWSFTENSGETPIKINLFVDRELRQFLKIIYDGEVTYEVTKLKIQDLSSELFDPPDDYTEVSY